MRLLCLLLALSGCSTKSEPRFRQTIAEHVNINWLAIYERELMIAFENEDREGCIFFGQEYAKEYKRIKDIDVKRKR